MIIDFTIENFRSLKDEAFFSLFAEHPKENLLSNIAYPIKENIGVLTCAAIYGANASGKSNILQAFDALRWMIRRSSSLRSGKKIPCYEPYALSLERKNDPVKFEIEFAIPGGRRFVYKLSFDSNKVIDEVLEFYPSRHKANIFTRQEGDSWETIKFGANYKGGIKRIPFFENQTYLSVAGQNAGAPKMIREVVEYFSKFLIAGVGRDMPLSIFYRHESMLAASRSFLRDIDVGIEGVRAIERNDDSLKFLTENAPENLRRLGEELKKDFVFTHRAEDGSLVDIPLYQESAGTQQLFKIFPLLLTSLRLGGVLIVDELESSFHPHIAELIIKFFSDPNVNKGNAQLIFTTHNLQLMNPSLLRRDQIWLVSKRAGATTLASLDEFDKRTVTTKTPYGEWYSDGRFGAVPQLNYSEIARFMSTMWSVIEDDEKDSIAISVSDDDAEA